MVCIGNEFGMYPDAFWPKQPCALNHFGAVHRDLCSDFFDLRAVLGGLRVVGSGNSHRDFEPILRYGHFALP